MRWLNNDLKLYTFYILRTTGCGQTYCTVTTAQTQLVRPCQPAFDLVCMIIDTLGWHPRRYHLYWYSTISGVMSCHDRLPDLLALLLELVEPLKLRRQAVRKDVLSIHPYRPPKQLFYVKKPSTTSHGDDFLSSPKFSNETEMSSLFEKLSPLTSWEGNFTKIPHTSLNLAHRQRPEEAASKNSTHYSLPAESKKHQPRGIKDHPDTITVSLPHTRSKSLL